jgi:hypothetical protein
MTNRTRTVVRAAHRTAWLLALPAVLLSTACRDAGPTSATPGPQLGIHANDPVAPDANARYESLILCKEWTNAADISVDFDVTVDDLRTGGVATTQVRTLTDTGSRECRRVARFDGTQDFDGPANLQVVENVPSGATLTNIVVTAVDPSGAVIDPTGAPYFSTIDVATGTWSAQNADNTIGFKVEYFNELMETGGEGCTPGYWKNHAGIYSHSRGGQKKPSAWEGYSPLDSYDAVFGVASSFNSTLIAALNRGGGGENALGRHAVAALLNAAHSGVDYAYSEGEVIQIVQDAYVTGDFTGAKDQLATENEQGCPL